MKTQPRPQLPQCISKEKFKQSLKYTQSVQKVWRNCVTSKYYCGIVGGGPPRCNILTYRSLFTLFADFACTFKLCLNFSFDIHCFAEVSVDFSMISLAFFLIFWTLCNPFGNFWDPLGTLRSSLGRQVALEAELWGHTKFWTKTSKLAEAFLKKWKGGPQNSSASTIFLKKT